MSNQPDSNPASNTPLVLSDDAAHKMLESINFFCGMSFNGANGPYMTSRQVARVRPNVSHSVQISQDISTEDYYPANDADAQNVHLGWPALGVLPPRPSDVLGQGRNTSSKAGNWVSRRMVVHRCTVSLRAEDLEPASAFTNAVEGALEMPTAAEQMQALCEVFGVWGEMIPLDAVVGASMAATGILAPNQNLTGDAATFRPTDRGPDVMQMIDRSLDITGSFEKRLESRILGGYPEIFSKSGFDAWLSNTLNIDNSSTWEVVKVNRAAPITDLLPKSLQRKIQRLCTYMVSRSTSVGNPVPLTFDGAAQGVKDIKKIDFWHNGATVQDLSIAYADGAVSGPYGFGKGKQPTDTFVLGREEFVTDVFVWATATDILAMQFAKNTGQVSSVYGHLYGTWDPYVLNGEGDALLGLSGTSNGSSITQLQAVWRSDLVEERYRNIAVTHTGNFAFNSHVFNDYGCLGDPFTARISQIKYRSATNLYVGYFQVTYSSDRCGRLVEQETPIRGTDYGAQDVWTLEEDEFIKKVRVRRNGTGIGLIEFYTNKGNSRKMGTEISNEAFYLEPPNKDMVLYYMMGRSAGVMNLASFVWGMPPA